jgi:hypothetical protein
MRPTWLLLFALAGCSSRTGSRADTPAPAPAAEADGVPGALDGVGPETPPAETLPDAPPDAPPDETADPPPVDAAPAADARCDPLHQELVAALATLPSPCATDADCTCYNGGVEGFTGCGGVSDRATSDRIYRVVEGYRALEREGVSCPHGLSVNCAPRMCNAACVDGRCGERRPTGIGVLEP